MITGELIAIFTAEDSILRFWVSGIRRRNKWWKIWTWSCHASIAKFAYPYIFTWREGVPGIHQHKWEVPMCLWVSQWIWNRWWQVTGAGNVQCWAGGRYPHCHIVEEDLWKYCTQYKLEAFYELKAALNEDHLVVSHSSKKLSIHKLG